MGFYICGIFLILLGLGLFGSTISLENEDEDDDNNGLKCWICNSLFDSKCNDIFVHEETISILKRNCKYLPSPTSKGPPVHRFIPATTCLKRILTNSNGLSSISRGCASPGDFGITNATNVDCTTVTSPDGTKTSLTCLCEGDYCNGSNTSFKQLTIILIFLPLLSLSRL